MGLAKRRLLPPLVLGIALAMTRSTHGTEFVTFDGAWWQSLAPDEQTAAVEGMLAGYEAGDLDGATYPPLPRHATLQQIEESASRLNHTSQATRSSNTFAVDVDHLTAVYRDHPTLLKNPVSSFYDCAFKTTDGCEATAIKFEELQLKYGKPNT
jgi:hypothetical protein